LKTYGLKTARRLYSSLLRFNATGCWTSKTEVLETLIEIIGKTRPAALEKPDHEVPAGF
jgi:hypothetical protein